MDRAGFGEVVSSSSAKAFESLKAEMLQARSTEREILQGCVQSHQSETEWPQKGTRGHKIRNPLGTFMLFCGYVPVGVSDFDEALADIGDIGPALSFHWRK